MSLIGVITAAGLQLASISLILSLFFFYFKEIPDRSMVTLVGWKSKGVGFWKTRLTTVGVRPLRGDLVCGHSG